MKQANRRVSAALAGCVLAAAAAGVAFGEDWPQWRGEGRDAHAAGFTAPATWPKQLAEKWKIAVGEGPSTPAVVGDRVYVFSRQDNNEVIRCLEAGSGKEVWSDKYEAQGATGPAAQFSGPRASPAVGEGKVVTVGVRGMVSCVDAASGKKIWRKDEFQAWPNFFAASSPVIVDGMAICELGGRGNGAIVAYDLASGEQKWKWTGDDPSYASPALMTVGDMKLVVAATSKKVIALNRADGKLVWEAANQGRYNASSPVVAGDTLIYATSNGFKAVKLAKAGEKVEGAEAWSNGDKAVMFNTPVVKDGLVYGVTQGNELFCLDAKTGKTAWGHPLGGGGGGMGGRPPGGPGGGGPGGPGGGGPGGPGAGGPPGGGGGGGGRPPGGGGGGGRRGGGGMGGGPSGFASVVDAGSVLMALTPSSDLIVFQPGAEKFNEVAKIKVASSPTHAYPVVTGNRVIVKDRDSVAALAVE